MTSLTKQPEPKNFFSLQTQRLAESFVGLNSSLAHSAPELSPCKDTCEQLDFTRTAWINPAAKVFIAPDF